MPPRCRIAADGRSEVRVVVEVQCEVVRAQLLATLGPKKRKTLKGKEPRLSTRYHGARKEIPPCLLLFLDGAVEEVLCLPRGGHLSLLVMSGLCDTRLSNV